MEGVGVIDRFLDLFSRYIDSGFGLIAGDVGFLASSLIVIDVTLALLFAPWGESADVVARLVKQTLQVGFFAFLIANWNGQIGRASCRVRVCKYVCISVATVSNKKKEQ